MGNGWVFSTAHMSPDEAKEKFVAALDSKPLFDPRLLRFKPGMRKKAWNKNVVAIGLASGFIEPLESTSIHQIMLAISRLIQNFPFDRRDRAAGRALQRSVAARIEHIRDFIILHYTLTERDDSAYWRHCRDMAIPASLAERIALFREVGGAYQANDELFRIDSWIMVMLGQGVFPESYHHVARMRSPRSSRKALGDLKTGIAHEVSHLPDHRAFVSAYAPAAIG